MNELYAGEQQLDEQSALAGKRQGALRQQITAVQAQIAQRQSVLDAQVDRETQQCQDQLLCVFFKSLLMPHLKDVAPLPSHRRLTPR